MVARGFFQSIWIVTSRKVVWLFFEQLRFEVTKCLSIRPTVLMFKAKPWARASTFHILRLPPRVDSACAGEARLAGTVLFTDADAAFADGNCALEASSELVGNNVSANGKLFRTG